MKALIRTKSGSDIIVQDLQKIRHTETGGPREVTDLVNFIFVPNRFYLFIGKKDSVSIDGHEILYVTISQ